MDSKYNKQAQAFLDKTKTTLEIEYIGHGPFWDDDKESRDIYRFTIKRDGRRYTAKFGQSIANSLIPGKQKRTLGWDLTKETKLSRSQS